MPNVTVRVGAVLIALGLVAYLASGLASLATLIPAAFGAVLVGLGVAAKVDGHVQTMMHFAMVVALLGLIGSVGQVFELPALLSGTAESPAAVMARAAMAVLLIGYLALGVRSFIAARRAR
ncbi:MAG TPA: hypothetical protein VLA20_01130 [Vicinamibacterales bacterium]|nr:hypothetical protein [Vicinamibacterales bacterium]